MKVVFCFMVLYFCFDVQPEFLGPLQKENKVMDPKNNTTINNDLIVTELFLLIFDV